MTPITIRVFYGSGAPFAGFRSRAKFYCFSKMHELSRLRRDFSDMIYIYPVDPVKKIEIPILSGYTVNGHNLRFQIMFFHHEGNEGIFTQMAVACLKPGDNEQILPPTRCARSGCGEYKGCFVFSDREMTIRK